MIQKNTVWNNILAFGLGYAGAILGTLSIQSIVLKYGWLATLLELATGFAGIAGWQLWKAQNQSSWIMIWELFGAALGTRITMWIGLS